PEILEGCGLVVAPGDVSALAGAIRRLLGDAGEAAALGRRARERCEARYSFRVARSILFPLLEQLTSSHAPMNSNRGWSTKSPRTSPCGATSHLSQATLGRSRPHGPRYNETPDHRAAVRLPWRRRAGDGGSGRRARRPRLRRPPPEPARPDADARRDRAHPV